MSQDRYSLWSLGVTHVLNASHCKTSSDDFYGTTVQYFGVNADDLPTFNISSFFFSSADFIHQALSTAGGINTSIINTHNNKRLITHRL